MNNTGPQKLYVGCPGRDLVPIIDFGSLNSNQSTLLYYFRIFCYKRTYLLKKKWVNTGITKKRCLTCTPDWKIFRLLGLLIPIPAFFWAHELIIFFNLKSIRENAKMVISHIRKWILFILIRFFGTKTQTRLDGASTIDHWSQKRQI